MPVVINKTESRIKVINLMRNAQAEWLTLADRAANWTPWARKSDDSFTSEDLEQAGGLNDFQVRRKNRKESKTKARAEKCNQRKLAQKTDIGGPAMAGEYVQAIIAPLDGNLDELKTILGDAEFAKFVTTNAQKHDDADLVKFVQAEETEFKSLDGKDLGSGFKAIFGELKEAQKADAMMAMPVMPHMDYWGEKVIDQQPFKRILEDKIYALSSAIVASIELSGEAPDWDSIETKSQDAIDGFDTWLAEAFDKLRGQATAVKSDTEKPSLAARIKNLFTSTPTKPQRQRRNAQKGDIEMTPEEIREIVREENKGLAEVAAQETVRIMAEKAEKMEAQKADSEAQKAIEAAQAERDAKLNSAIEWIEAQKAEVEARKAEKELTDEQRAAELEALKAKQAEIAEKMDALERTPGSGTSPEDSNGKRKILSGGEALKYDPENPFECFNTIGVA